MILTHGFGMLTSENGVHKLLVESKRALNLKNVDFSIFLKKTSFFLVKTVKKIDIFDQVQAKMTFSKSENFSTVSTIFTRKKNLKFFSGVLGAKIEKKIDKNHKNGKFKNTIKKRFTCFYAAKSQKRCFFGSFFAISQNLEMLFDSKFYSKNYGFWQIKCVQAKVI